MAKTTLIPWTHHTFNLVWGCKLVSPGCAHCYAARKARRWGWDCFGDKPRRTLSTAYWRDPLKWAKAARKAGVRRRVFVSSMCDPFEDHPTVAAERDKLWPLIRATPELDWLILTKRPENITGALPEDWYKCRPSPPYSNVWLGVSIESNKYAWRALVLAGIPTAIRFVSYEPALGPLDELSLDGIDWVIYGGESGPNFRPHNVQWARDVRDSCRRAGIAFFFKQSPHFRPDQGIELDGEIIREWPR